jgi:hypothetical protein
MSIYNKTGWAGLVALGHPGTFEECDGSDKRYGGALRRERVDGGAIN